MTRARLDLSRDQVIAFRRKVGSLDERLPHARPSLRSAAWAGLQDSMPRAAVLSLHARVDGVAPSDWEHPSLVQLWGPRFSAYVVAARDLAVFSLGRLPDDEKRRRTAGDLAERLRRLLGSAAMSYAEAGRALGESPNRLRYAATTGTVIIRWDGARRPTIRSLPPPAMDPREARLELARRHLRVFAPATPQSFARWAGVRSSAGAAAFDALGTSLTPVRSPVGAGWILAEDESAIRAGAEPAAPARLLPSGDAYTLLWGPERELLVPEEDHRSRLWTPRVWPGAILVDGDIVGTWRRAGNQVTLSPWGRLPRRSREAVAAEAEALPLPDVDHGVAVSWDG